MTFGSRLTTADVDIDDACTTVGIPPPADGQPVDARVLAMAFKAKARACHPDRHGGDPDRNDELRRLNAARAQILAYNERLLRTDARAEAAGR